MSDEEALFDLLAKFLVKEGYEVRRLSRNTLEIDGCTLMIYAPTRDLSGSKVWFEKLKKKIPTLLAVQCCDEDCLEIDDNVVVFSERPINLRQLGDTIKRTIENSDYVQANSFHGKIHSGGVSTRT